MVHEVQGVVARTAGAPVSVETILVPEPGPGEVLVRVQACGVCHTDLHYREGGITDDFPFLLGHEAAGTVEAVWCRSVERRGRRLCGAGMACSVWRLSILSSGTALVLFRESKRCTADDLAGRDALDSCARYRSVRGTDPGGRRTGRED